MPPAQPSTSRLEATNAVVTALRSAPIDWRRLLAVLQDLAPQLRSLDDRFIEPPPELRADLVKLVPTSPPNDPDAAEVQQALQRTLLFIVDFCSVGTAAALAKCFDDAINLVDPSKFLRNLIRFVALAGLPLDLSVDELSAVGRHLSRYAQGRIDVLLAGLDVLGLAKNNTYAARRGAFCEVATPLLAAAAREGQVDTMLSIEAHLYSLYLKMFETREHHLETLAAVEAAAANLPYQARTWRPRSSPRPKIAFLIPNGVILAHTELLLTFLSGLSQLDDPPIEPIVLIYMDASGGQLGRKLDLMKVRWMSAGLAAPFAYEALFETVRDQVAEIDADAVVFVSIPLFIAYFCRRPLAPAQIWWPMKFFMPCFDGLDGRVSYNSLSVATRIIDGRLWREGPLSLPPPPPADPQDVSAIRARFPNMTLLGTISREEKIADPAFLTAVAEILRRHTDACFLWTGREKLSVIDDFFRAAGLGDRCHFIGWVEPTPYLMAFDLVLETPLTGLMFGWAMALGKPLLSLGARGLIGVHLAQILDGTLPVDPRDRERIEAVFAPIRDHLPGLWAADGAQMVEFADILLGDVELRKTLGEVQKAYVDRFMVSEAVSARIQAQHFADIALEKRLATG